MIEPDIGVPQRVPEQLGDLAHHFGGHVVVQQHQIQIGVGHHLPATETAGGDDGKAAVRDDSQFGSLCGEPKFMQIQQGLAQRRCIESALPAVEQLPVRRRKILGVVE